MDLLQLGPVAVLLLKSRRIRKSPMSGNLLRYLSCIYTSTELSEGAFPNENCTFSVIVMLRREGWGGGRFGHGCDVKIAVP